MTKTYSIILINGEHYAVDNEASCPAGCWAIFPDTINGEIKSFNLFIKCKWNYAANGRYNLLVVATTDKSLSLPLLPLDDDINLLANKVIEEAFGESPQIMSDTKDICRDFWVDGYKAAKGKKYSEEDMRKAIQRTFDITHNNALLIKEDCKRIEGDTLDSLKPILKSVELEMEPDPLLEKCCNGICGCKGECVLKEPTLKLTKDGYVIVKRFLYDKD